jgi:hypothetical protein
MKRPSFLIALSMLLTATAPLAAQQTATQLVRFSVIARQQATVQTLPAPITPAAGSSAASTGSYAFATMESDRKISASLDQAMPSGSSLVVVMTAPAGGRSAGESTLGTDAVDVVTAIPASDSSGLPVRYSVRAPSGIGSAAVRTVTYTVTTAP